LTKFYGPTRGIENLDLSVERGEVFGFLGPNGAGKTTTIRLLVGLLKPTAGEAWLDGQRVDMIDPAYRKEVGYLPGEPGLYGYLTGREFIERWAALRAEATDKALELAARFDLDLDRKIKGFSHGMKQKLAIVAAFMHGAPLLILDEPTQGLDPLAQQEFYKLIEEEHASGKTIFLSSHILVEVERVCHRVGIVREGRLIAVEHIDDLKSKRVKHLEAQPTSPVDAENFLIPGVKTATYENGVLSLTIDGNYPAILRALSELDIVNIRIGDASLEEIFLEYYSESEESDR